MDIRENWDTFCLNADTAPDYLAEETLFLFAVGLQRSKEEREKLAVRAQAGDADALKEFVDSYVPMIVSGLSQRKDITPPYSKDLFFQYYDKLQKYVSDRLFLKNLEYDTWHYVFWMVADTEECERYIMQQQRKHEKEKECLERRALVDETYEAYMDSMPDLEFWAAADGETPSSEVELVAYMKEKLSEYELKIILFRCGFLDGKTRTLEEVAEYYGISRERVRQLEAKALRKLRIPRHRSVNIADFLKD